MEARGAVCRSVMGKIAVDMKQSKNFYEKFLLVEAADGNVVRNFRMGDSDNLWLNLKRRYFSDHFVLNSAPREPDDPYERWDIVYGRWSLDREISRNLSRIPKGQALVFTSKNLHTQVIQGKRYDPYLDPVVKEIASMGLLPVKLQVHEGMMGECFFQPVEILLHAAKALLPTRMLPPITGFDEYVELSRTYGAPVMEQAIIQAEYYELLSYADVFQAVLEILRPRFVILECYYALIHMGLALACRRLGIPCVEYQHGMQCNHFMYTFHHVPEWGFEVLPEWFFTWGEDPARRLLDMFKNQKYHKVAIAGKPEFIACAQGYLANDPREVEPLRARIGGRKAVLVPLMLTVDNDSLAALRGAIINSPPDWIWLLRQHPLTPSNELDLPESFNRVEVELCSRLLLHTVLSLTDHVVCGCSSVCLEALFLYGIPITLLGSIAEEFFRDYIKPGLMDLATSQGAIFDSIHSRKMIQHPERIENSYIVHDHRLLGQQLRRLARQRS